MRTSRLLCSCAWLWGGCSDPRGTRRLRSSAGRRGSGAKVPPRSTRLSWSGWVVRWLRILDTGVRVLPQRDWEERERRIYRRLRGSVDSDRCRLARSSCLASLERRWRPCWRIRSWRSRSGRAAIELAVIALAEFHRLGFTHGDAMAENVLIDLDAGVAHWFDFETIHDSSRPMAWRRADDRASAACHLPGPNRSREARRDPSAHPGCLRGRRSHPPSGHELRIAMAASARLPPRPGGLVVSVFPGDRPVAARALDEELSAFSVGHDPDGHVHTQRIAPSGKGVEVLLVVAFPLPAV